MLYNKEISITFLVMMMMVVIGNCYSHQQQQQQQQQIIVQFNTTFDCRENCDFNDPNMWIGGVVPNAPGYVAVIDYSDSDLGSVQTIISSVPNLQLDSIILNTTVHTLMQLNLINNVELLDEIVVGVGCVVYILNNSTVNVKNNLTIQDQGTVYVTVDSTVTVGSAWFQNGSSYTQQVRGFFSSSNSALLDGSILMLGDASLAVFGDDNVIGGSIQTGSDGIVVFENVLVAETSVINLQGNLVVSGVLEISRSASVAVNYNVSVIAPRGSIVLDEYATFKQSPDPSTVPPPTNGGPVIVQIDNLIGQSSSQVSIGRADELLLGVVDLDGGQLQITSLVQYTDIMGPANISQLVLAATKSVHADDLHFTIFTGQVNISQIYSYFHVGKPSTVSIVFDEDSSLTDTPITLYNTILTVSKQSVLNITTPGYFSLSNDSQIVVGDGSSLNLYRSEFTAPNITTGTGSSVSIVSTTMTGNILIGHSSSLFINQSSITGDISVDDAKLMFVQSTVVSGGLYVYSQSAMSISVDSLATSPDMVPISTGSFELNDGTLSLNTLQPTNSLQVGQTYYIVSSSDSLVVQPSLCSIQFPLPSNQNYTFDIIPNNGNGISYLVFQLHNE
ncbi:hypothetical protein DFA_09282 [Cavenderia fasciculata]|uniref:Uncharacterized protein n=1 Tax=Cavenderia fasciculata TaxID=261658 RepID=F4Q770_CACFS|nr:uncharacterized protein DFA_09282 [Cavenderia fasciculata]EGG16252.1 hypothetical protein DFA_09282 [Cavenderia fasciculata]|eukprot:XP_004354636.1 hypothetical protein DFA_09282 [Cavenderia fasciculata]